MRMDLNSISALDVLIKNEKDLMLLDLKYIVADTQANELKQPATYGDSIDIRLCIDADASDFGWIFRTGDASFDQRHSDHCASSSIDATTRAEVLLNELLDQMYEEGIA
jgi:hypothetical protein